MKYTVKNGNIIFPRTFDLEQTFFCGQCFRWSKCEDGSFHGIAFGRSLHLSETEDTVILQNTSEEDFQNIWVPYFDLDTNYARIRKMLCDKSLALTVAASYAKGIHILRQEPWETLCSFIISQNNNIPRTQKIINSLCEAFGEPLSDGSYAFPSPEIIAALQEDDLAPMRSGFRAKYLIDAACKVNSHEIDLDALYTLPLETARRTLMIIRGVGPKVAECVLLYGFHRMEAFPVDVWMARAMVRLFPGESPDSFGDYAGLAQQYIYHYSRMHPEIFAGEGFDPADKPRK